MTRILITVGPQGAGKTTFCTSLMAGTDTTKVSFFCRDKFLEGLFGNDAWNPYLGLYVPGMEKFWKTVATHIKEKDVVLIDSFFPSPRFLKRCLII
jgi:GTPase SAR1 family protein